MDLFHHIEDGVAILRAKGLYRQVKVYHRGQDVFAGYSGGFIKLGPHKGTTRPDIAWEGIEADGVRCDRVGAQPRFTPPLRVAS